MSRIGKQPVIVPDGVTVAVANGQIAVKGPKGELQQDVPAGVSVKTEEKTVVVEPLDGGRQALSSWGLTRSLVNNMVIGVSQGFEKALKIEGTGYRCEQKKLNGNDWLQLSLGYSHPILFEVPEGITTEVDKQGRIVVKGVDKWLVGEIASMIRRLRPPEPYKGKGVRYEGEQIRRKVGKAGAR